MAYDPMKRILIELAVHIVLLAVLVTVIGALAIFFGATTGATATAIAPDFHMKLVAGLGLICPKGDTIAFRHDRQSSTTDSLGRPVTGFANDVTCTSPAEGTSHLLDDVEYLNARIQTLGAAIAGYTLLCFVPLFLPLEILALIVAHKLVAGIMKPAPAGQSVISA